MIFLNAQCIQITLMRNISKITALHSFMCFLWGPRFSINQKSLDSFKPILLCDIIVKKKSVLPILIKYDHSTATKGLSQLCLPSSRFLCIEMWYDGIARAKNLWTVKGKGDGEYYHSEKLPSNWSHQIRTFTFEAWADETK